MAVWIGAAAVAPLGMRRDFSLGPNHAQEFLVRLHNATKVIVVAALATIATGFALMQFHGGWTHLPMRMRAGIVLTIVVILLGSAGSRPTLNALATHFATGSGVAAADPLRRRFLLLINLEMALRIAVLALMVLRF